jgi:protein DJ-1
MVAAICAAPSALAAHGIGAGAQMTCHPSVREVVAKHARHRDARVVEDGALVTSQGPGTAFEFALALAARLVSPARAKEVAGPMLLAAGSELPG